MLFHFRVLRSHGNSSRFQKKIWKHTFLEMNTKKPKSNNAASWRFILLLLSAHTKHETKKFKISNTLKSLCYGI